jgi:hypothetical protein
LINADGTGERRLVPGILASGEPPVWSPDGSRLAFMSFDYSLGGARRDLYVVDVASGSFRALTQGAFALGSPTWSPDGNHLAVVDRDELVVVAADGSTRSTLLARSDDDSVSPVWSSQDEIAYTRLSGPSIAVRTIRPDGSGDRLLASVRGLPRAWSRDGETLLMDELEYPSNGRQPIAGRRLFSVRRDHLLTRLTQGEDALRQDRDVAWSADESRIVFSRLRPTPELPPEVWTANADGTCERLIVREAHSPAWQPVAEGPQGELRCTELRLLPETGGTADGQFSLQILNDGTEPVRSIELRATVRGGGTLRILPNFESCRAVRAGIVKCRLSSLSRGKTGAYLVEVRPRVVTRRAGRLQATDVRFELEPIGEPYDVALRFAGCSEEDPGSGVIMGTRWNDLICGRNGADRITAGAGRDNVLGGRGNDTILARDRALDAISCGRGRDRVAADRRDRVSRDCERVTRR